VVGARRGSPLAVGLTAANRPDAGRRAAPVDAVPPVQRPRGRPRRRPAKRQADKGYGYRHRRDAPRRRGSAARLARKGVGSDATLGRQRWGAARTRAWLARYRRLTIRDARLAARHQAFLELGCALLCLRALRRPPPGR
jgi:transposase